MAIHCVSLWWRYERDNDVDAIARVGKTSLQRFRADNTTIKLHQIDYWFLIWNCRSRFEEVEHFLLETYFTVSYFRLSSRRNRIHF